MKKEDQIAEIIMLLKKPCDEIVVEAGVGSYCARPDSCDECLATLLYDAGYRKQIQCEWIVIEADSGSFGEYEPFIEFKCPKCESVYGIESGQYDWHYGDPIPWVSCPLCGAKMKGGDLNV